VVHVPEGKGGSITKLNPDEARKRLQDRLSLLMEEKNELDGDMNENVRSWTHDFMNLIFG
jgi:hypothetical protein